MAIAPLGLADDCRGFERESSRSPGLPAGLFGVRLRLAPIAPVGVADECRGFEREGSPSKGLPAELFGVGLHLATTISLVGRMVDC